ncbi:large conductance mechanosensitive channel protein MscL [Cryobacterium melibiosiphilum]|uniref:Large-conductance mechanosensitive channel n=1 Tax=Cryobacterium melibiosiphilum TaxID=995039 RepID=A0A3A5MDG2_9MICO|nr:large conductance mechanosensitive channel protein MscL [Cryobacterium melibiosiphilum]RJT86199.1 large conductance mechanosensitive channel protein MscL [Cryobacterium melibiosiphilum]
MISPAAKRAAILLDRPAAIVKGGARIAGPTLNGFKAFIMRGNVIDLAVAVVIGTAFTAVVTAIVGSVFTPLIASLFDASSLEKALIVPLPGSIEGEGMLFGAVIAAVINFLLIAFVVYFVLVMPISRLRAAQDRRRDAGIPVEDVADPTTELDLLTEIRDLLAAGAVDSAARTAAAAAASAGSSAAPDAPKHTL